MTSYQDHIKWFRNSSPYIDAHRGKTFVICLSDMGFLSPNMNNLISDLALMNSLGIMLVIVFGNDKQITDHLAIEWPTDGEYKVTSPEVMQTVIRITGSMTSNLMSQISSSNLDPMVSKNEISAVCGNFLRAKPLGIINGVNYQQTGDLRRLNSSGVRYQLKGGSIVLLPAIGYSPSGEIFYLDANNTASQVAGALQADKLIYLIKDEGLRDKSGKLINEVDLTNKKSIGLPSDNLRLVNFCDAACQAGVDRCHVISYEKDGALLEELFTRDGCGTQVVSHSYERIRNAVVDDVTGVLSLIEPLENEGVLAKRSRELLESEIDRFIVIERDSLLIGCAALYEFGSAGELACLVTHPDYRDNNRGNRLLDWIEVKAKKAGIKKLFALTTRTLHWFLERDFEECEIEELPEIKREFYNYQRNSRVVYKKIS